MDFASARHNMVENQIRANRVTDPVVISAMTELPREVFVPEQLQGIAYVDEDIVLGQGRCLMEPMVLARLLQGAVVQSSDVVLDVGCGSGYSAAVLARMASTVVALEPDAGLAARANEIIAELGIDTVTVVEGPMKDGWSEQAPYDVILFDGAVPEVPSAIRDQLAEGGRLVAVIAGRGMGKAVLITRHGGTYSRCTVFDAATSSLPGFVRRPTFEF
ncbi:MAG: protein-L-isoaspartate O-methyltransferase [Rhodospirillales bacterium]|nr:protein-L-isoaspartate O-methyltransferase [Rhodospirillales bacterium]HJO73017.1 protein-L-isoaspartate O-methyltransferase [Rhodospirillales bacterium]